jgi:hypothetical protein
MQETSKLLKEIAIIKQAILAIEGNGMVIGDWISQKAVKKFFDYGDNQLRTLEKTHSIVVSKIGRRKFYSLESIFKLIEENKQ